MIYATHAMRITTLHDGARVAYAVLDIFHWLSKCFNILIFTWFPHIPGLFQDFSIKGHYTDFQEAFE